MNFQISPKIGKNVIPEPKLKKDPTHRLLTMFSMSIQLQPILQMEIVIHKVLIISNKNVSDAMSNVTFKVERK